MPENGSTKWMTTIGISYPTRHKYFFIEFSKKSLKLIPQEKQMCSNEENICLCKQNNFEQSEGE